MKLDYCMNAFIVVRFWPISLRQLVSHDCRQRVLINYITRNWVKQPVHFSWDISRKKDGFQSPNQLGSNPKTVAPPMQLSKFSLCQFSHWPMQSSTSAHVRDLLQQGNVNWLILQCVDQLFRVLLRNWYSIFQEAPRTWSKTSDIIPNNTWCNPNTHGWAYVVLVCHKQHNFSDNKNAE